jgi:hypothetical protein
LLVFGRAWKIGFRNFRSPRWLFRGWKYFRC